MCDQEASSNSSPPIHVSHPGLNGTLLISGPVEHTHPAKCDTIIASI